MLLGAWVLLLAVSPTCCRVRCVSLQAHRVGCRTISQLPLLPPQQLQLQQPLKALRQRLHQLSLEPSTSHFCCGP